MYNKTQPTTTQEVFTTKVDQFTYTYNPVTKQVIHNAKSGDKVETNETQINKVLAAYGKANNFETKVFNKQEYVKVDNKVLNVNTGSRVTQKEILDLFTTQEVKTKPVVNYETEVYNTLKALEDAEFNVNDVSPETIASEDFSKYPKTLEYLNSGYVVDNTQFNLITQNKNEFEKLLNKTKATDLISLLDALTELKNVSSIETKIETKELSDTNQDEKLLEDLDNDEFIDKFSLDPTEEDWTSESNECGI